MRPSTAEAIERYTAGMNLAETAIAVRQLETNTMLALLIAHDVITKEEYFDVLESVANAYADGRVYKQARPGILAPDLGEPPERWMRIPDEQVQGLEARGRPDTDDGGN